MWFDHIVCLTPFFGRKINYSCVIDEFEIDLKWAQSSVAFAGIKWKI